MIPLSQEEIVVMWRRQTHFKKGPVLDISGSKVLNNGRKHLGRTSRGSDCPRILDKQDQEILQLDSAKGSFKKNYQGPPLLSVIRQCHGSSLHLKAGRHKKQGSAAHGPSDPDMQRTIE